MYTCGYPLNSEFKTKTLNIDLTPMSDLSHGSGYADNGIIFDLTSDQMLEGAMYKDGKFIEFSSMVGYRFKKGKLFLLLTNGRDRAKYNLKLRKLDEKERLNLLEPKI